MQRYDRTGMSPVWLSSFIQGKPSLLIPPRALVRHHLNRGYLDHSWGTCGSWKWWAINPQDIFRTLRKRGFDLQQAEKLKGAGLGKWPLSPTACIKLAKQGTSAGKALRYLKLLVSRWVLTPRKSGDLKKIRTYRVLGHPATVSMRESVTRSKLSDRDGVTEKSQGSWKENSKNIPRKTDLSSTSTMVSSNTVS
jgi:hypothetical protein